MPTRDDVAALAGVSKSTVSRVLNNSGYVSAENREKIENAINALGYTPNLIARGLKTKATRQILFHANELSNPFYIEVYHGMEDYAREQGYSIAVSSRFDRTAVKQRQFDGVILSGVSAELRTELQKMEVPAVVTDYCGQPLSVPSVGMDITEGAVIAVNHLFSRGHRAIGFLTYIEDEAELRYQGYLAGLKENGVKDIFRFFGMRDHGSCPSNYHQGYAAAAAMLESKAKLTAVLAFNDAMAIGALCALSEKGIRVPEDISLIGFDDILQARFTCPPLTTIYMPKYEQGWECAKALIQLIQGKPAQSRVLKTRLVVRSSVKTLI